WPTPYTTSMVSSFISSTWKPAIAGPNASSPLSTPRFFCAAFSLQGNILPTKKSRTSTKIYHRVDWPWMLNGGKTFSMAWHPESGFLNARWEHYCELMMIYLLAIGSPTHPVSANSWDAWTRPKIKYQGIEYISGNDPIFTHQYS